VLPPLAHCWPLVFLLFFAAQVEHAEEHAKEVKAARRKQRELIKQQARLLPHNIKQQ